MSTLTLEGFSPELYAKLEQMAVRNHRSITQQASLFLEKCLKESTYPEPFEEKMSPPQPWELPEPINVGVKMDSDWIYNAISEGRK